MQFLTLYKLSRYSATLFLGYPVSFGGGIFRSVHSIKLITYGLSHQIKDLMEEKQANMLGLGSSNSDNSW